MDEKRTDDEAGHSPPKISEQTPPVFYPKWEGHYRSEPTPEKRAELEARAESYKAEVAEQDRLWGSLPGKTLVGIEVVTDEYSDDYEYYLTFTDGTKVELRSGTWEVKGEHD